MPGQKANSHPVYDDGDLRLVSSIVLTQEGYRVRSTEDGSSAFCQTWNKVPDIISSDINMPGMRCEKGSFPQGAAPAQNDCFWRNR